MNSKTESPEKDERRTEVGTALFASGAATAVTSRKAGGIPHGGTVKRPRFMNSLNNLDPESRIEPLDRRPLIDSNMTNCANLLFPLRSHSDGRGEGQGR
jgi:hypothetical protein